MMNTYSVTWGGITAIRDALFGHFFIVVVVVVVTSTKQPTSENLRRTPVTSHNDVTYFDRAAKFE